MSNSVSQINSECTLIETKKIISNFFLIFITLLLFSCTSSKKKKVQKIKPETTKKPLFTLLNPRSTGLFFANEMHFKGPLNILTYEYLYNGGGVAIGDINNDDLPDVFFSANFSGSKLFLNRGNLRFSQIPLSGDFQLGFTTGVSMVDINGDGYDDIYLCKSLSKNPENRANVLLINNQNGTFTNMAKEYGIDDKSFSNYASFFDYDNDGDLDMFLLNHRNDFKDADAIQAATDNNKLKKSNYKYNSNRLYRNNGNNTFTDVTKRANLLNHAFGLSATVSDINNDGWRDIYVGNDYSEKDHFYINNKNGTFSDKIDDMFFHTSKNAMGSDIADINNDGLLDLINLDMIAEDNYRQKQLKGQIPYDFYHLAVKSGLSHQVMRNTLQLNNGNGTFSEIGQLAGVSHTDWSWTPLIADFDNDGFKDIFISNGFYKDIGDMDYIKYDSNTAIQNAGGKEKVNSSSLVELMKSNAVVNYLYKNNGDLTFTKKSKDWGIKIPTFSNGAVYADLDLDGDLDLIINNYNLESFLYRNNSREIEKNNKYLTIKLKGLSKNPNAIGTKVKLISKKGEQFLESSPYRGFYSSVDPLLHFGLGKDVDSVSLAITWPNGKYQELKNVKTNQRLVLKIPHTSKIKPVKKSVDTPLLIRINNKISSNYKHKEDNFIDFKREPLLEHKISNKGPFLAKSDVNNDGLTDIYLGGASGQSGQLYVQNKEGDFNLKFISDFKRDAGFEDVQAIFVDVDNDNDLDLYVVSGGYAFPKDSEKYQDRLYINDGEGNFSKSEGSLPKITSNGTTVLSLDLDQDGDNDLFVGGNAIPNAYPFADKSYLLINNNGIFSDASELLPKNGNLGIINDAIYSDIDNDNVFELVLAGEWMPITVLKYIDSKFIISKNRGLKNSFGWWNTIEILDVDNDGNLDIIAGNRGNNSYLKASKKYPAYIYAKDFDNNGSIDAFPFYFFNDGKSYPKHILDGVFKQYPNIRRKFQRYEKYSNATLDSIFTKKEQEGMLTLKATTFSTTLFKNLGNGEFTPLALNNFAQFSEIHGILPIDLNNDNYLDVIVTGNNYGVDVEAGRNDANIGTVLLNDKKGNLNPIKVNKSGFFIPKDTRGIYKVDNLIYVMVNNDKPYIFKMKN